MHVVNYVQQVFYKKCRGLKMCIYTVIQQFFYQIDNVQKNLLLAHNHNTHNIYSQLWWWPALSEKGEGKIKTSIVSVVFSSVLNKCHVLVLLSHFSTKSCCVNSAQGTTDCRRNSQSKAQTRVSLYLLCIVTDRTLFSPLANILNGLICFFFTFLNHWVMFQFTVFTVFIWNADM